jgi:Zn-dependent protease
MIRTAPVYALLKLGPKLISVTAKLLKSAKGAKAGLAAASLVSYGWLFSWPFAVLIVLSLVIHEYGHVRAMKAVGIPTRGFYLIPFVGGAAVPERAFHSRLEEQFVAMAGPAFGLAQAAFFCLVYKLTDHPLAAVIAAWVALLNLINLLPISPLDGGRIVKSIAFSVHSMMGMIFLCLGLAGGLALMVYLDSKFMAVILLLAAFDLFLEQRNLGLAYLPQMTPNQTWRSFFTYGFACLGFVLIIAACLPVPEAAVTLEFLRD